MMNELICSVCFTSKPRFIRQCRCFYCEECKNKAQEVCSCGGTGCWSDITQSNIEELKYVALDNQTLLRKLNENFQEKMLSVLSNVFGTLYSVFELRGHQQKQMYRFLTNKIKSVQQENEELKKKGRDSQPPYEIKGGFPGISQLDEFKFSTPRGQKPLGTFSGSNSKKPFDHEGFASFFSKK